MADFSKILAENQQEMQKLTAPSGEKVSNVRHRGDTNSETENIFAAPTLTPMKTKAAVFKNTPLVSHNT